MGSGGRIQRKTTEKIAAKLADEILRTCGKESILRTKADEEFLACSVIMPMDMDLAHIAGFTGSTIYHALADKVVCYERKDAFAPEKDEKEINLSRERPNQVWVYQEYKLQIDATIAAVLKSPWVLLPMFHYDPRRWCNASGGNLDKKLWKYGPWDFSFSLIATLRSAGIFIGFKMYPPLGYKPFDSRLPHLPEFYARCAAEGIPILTHCSPGGLVTHEDEFYFSLDGVNLEQRKSNNAHRIISYDPATPEGYFQDEYVHPKNWRQVLENGNSDLKLCLAHFGGDEWTKTGIESDWIQEIVRLTKEFPNVYTDMSCYNLKNDAMRNNIQVLLKNVRDNPDYHHLKDKLIFGVDWYLSMITEAPEYKEYVESFYTMMKEIDEEQWQPSTVVNPARFYGFDDKQKIGNIYRSLDSLIGDDSELKANLEDRYKKISKINDYITAFESKK